jgi:glutamate dehydrogenase
VQSQMLIDLGRLIRRATTWFLHSRRLSEDMAETIRRFEPGTGELGRFIAAAPIGAPWRAPIAERQRTLQANRVPAELALQVAASETLLAALDMVEVAEASRQSLQAVATTYFGIGDLLGLARLRAQVSALPADGYWRGMAKGALGDDLLALQRELATDAVAAGGADAWEVQQRTAIDRARRMLSELSEAKNPDLAMLSVALRELRHLTP